MNRRKGHNLGMFILCTSSRVAAARNTQLTSYSLSSSKPTTSNKRKAPTAASKSRPTADEDPAESSGDEQIASADAATSAPQRQTSTRRNATLKSAGPPPTKIRRVGTKSRVKVEPSEPTGIVDRVVGERTAHASPRRAQIMEVVLASPAVTGKGKAKAREAPPKVGRSEVESDGEDDSGETSARSQAMKARASGEHYQYACALDCHLRIWDICSFECATACSTDRYD